MIISALVAMDDEGAIGKDGAIPWNLPADMKHLRELTMGKPIIMGRATHESIGRTLPGRLNIVISTNPTYRPHEGSVLANSLDKALQIPEVKNAQEVIIFGGQAIYELAMPKTSKIYLTKVHTVSGGDKFFRYNPNEWKVIANEKHSKDSDNPYDYEFQVLERS